MNRKILLAAAGTVAALSLAAGSLSYFTAEAHVDNVVTMGDVECELDEPDFRETYGEDMTASVMPGTKINKDPTVKNSGLNDAWLFVEAEITWAGNAPEGAVLPTFEELGIEANTDFTLHGQKTTHALFAYDKTFAKDAEVEAFLSKGEEPEQYTMEIPFGWEEDYKDAGIQITVTAHAIQKDNIATQADAAEELKLSTLLAQE